MQTKIMTIFTRTPLHVGAGSSVGAIDQPVIRERHTRFPIISGSAIKGVLADLWNDERIEAIDKEGNPKTDKNGNPIKIRSGKVLELFGSDDNNNASAGHLLIGEARVIAFPVRSAKGSFAWITCPLALRRFERDANVSLNVDQIEGMNENQCIATKDVILDDKHVILEEYCFETLPNVKIDISDIANELGKYEGDPVWEEVANRLVVVNDEMFSYFVENACEVVTRIKIKDETGTVDGGALFNQEQVPSETMFYAVFGETKTNCLDALQEKLSTYGNLLQIGGDGTIGIGYCTVKLNEQVKK